jgi:hypothetical protein
MSHDPTTTLAGRLERLEARNEQLAGALRRWRRGSVAALAGGLVLVALAGAGGAELAKTIAARQFELRDESGTLRAALAMRPDGTPGLALLDAKGRLRLSLDLAADGAPGVHLHDPAGALRAAVAVRPDGTPGVALFDEQGAIRASMDLGADRASGVHVYDGTGMLRGALALRPDGTPALGLFNGRGEVERSIESEGEADSAPAPEAGAERAQRNVTTRSG